jgi:16S rRNA (cytidine1402-2'-O)-methyltransferase
MSNTLYIVSTPIGNLEDISYRAVRILQQSTLILCEDTRHSRSLLTHYGIETQVQTYHDFNKEKVSAKYIKHLDSVGDIALICDAGTPGIADPAFYLVRECHRANICVSPIPGASALLSALVGSGMPTNDFRFMGFAPKKSAARLTMFKSLVDKKYTFCFYVSPHNLVKMMGELNQVFPEHTFVLARELTKKFEEFLHFTPSQALEHYQERKPKGEYVMLFHPFFKSLGKT